MPTIESLVIRNIPEFEELPDNLNKSGLSSITVLNTSLKEFPKHFENIKHLNTLSIINSKLTELPVSLQKLEKSVCSKFGWQRNNLIPCRTCKELAETRIIEYAKYKVTVSSR